MDHIKRYQDNFLNEGDTPPETYYDMNMEPVEIGDLVEVKVTSGRYGQTKTYQGEITDFGESNVRQIKLDGEKWFSPFEYDHKTRKYVGRGENHTWDHAHTRYCKKITEDDLDPKLRVPKAYRPEYTVWYVDYTDGKNKDKSYYHEHPVVASKMNEDQFDKWLQENYPNVKTFKYGEKHPKYDEVPYLQVHISAQHGSGFLKTYYIMGE